MLIFWLCMFKCNNSITRFIYIHRVIIVVEKDHDDLVLCIDNRLRYHMYAKNISQNCSRDPFSIVLIAIQYGHYYYFHTR